LMHLRIQALVTVLYGYKNLFSTKNVSVAVFLDTRRLYMWQTKRLISV
jgi:hypothetical protein